MDFSEIREIRKQNKRDTSRAILGNEEELISSTSRTTKTANVDDHHDYDQNHSPTVSKTIEFEVLCSLTNSLLAAKSPDDLLTPKFDAEKQAEFNKGVEGATKFLLSKFSDL
ncbi:unnamed protein product [Fraxinus pennsylvanica]|uniref:Uncharacterized protein n=1 Tax=Fraxinus pennsylvanica TaxID=56036 RepID=A0AAD2EBA8_9LAMI|nr:unnamed protein product [Fraxinus pennsylvanica]